MASRHVLDGLEKIVSDVMRKKGKRASAVETSRHQSTNSTELQIEWHQGNGVHRGMMIPWRVNEQMVKRVALPSKMHDDVARMIVKNGFNPDDYIFSMSGNNFIYAKENVVPRDGDRRETIKIDDGAIEVFWIDDAKKLFSALLIPIDVAPETIEKSLMTWSFNDEKDVKFSIACKERDPSDFLERSRYGWTSMGWIRDKRELFDPEVRSFLCRREKRVPPTVRVNG
jgi:hypothetical protein